MKRYGQIVLYVFLLFFLLAFIFTPTIAANAIEFTADSGVYDLIGQSTNDHTDAFYLWEYDGYTYVAISTSLKEEQLGALTINGILANTSNWLLDGSDLTVKDSTSVVILDNVQATGKAAVDYFWLIGKVDIDISEEIEINLSAPGGFALDTIYTVQGALNVFHEYPPDAPFQDFDQSEASNTVGGLAAGVYVVYPEDPPEAGYEYSSVAIEIDGAELLPDTDAGATDNETFAHGTVHINQFGVVTVTLTSTSSKIIDINYFYDLQTYTVTYSANTGTGTLVDPDSPYRFKDTVAVLDPEDISKTGYEFVKWNEAAGGTGTAHDPGYTFSMPAANVVLYAQWEAIDYTLKINYYYSSVGGSVAAPIYVDDTLNVGDAYSVASPVISGYTASQVTVAGTMPANNVTVNVIYTSVGERDPFIPSPSITVKKHISVDGGTNWLDAETAPGPSVAEGSALRFKFVVTNTGNVSLSDLTLTDSEFTLSGAVKPAFLNPGASFEYILTGITAAAGQHQNTAYASGAYGGLVYSDFDHAHYWGSKKDAPSISIKKYVSVDKGLSWLDANTAPGPTADIGKEVRYKFVIVNSGNVTLTGLSLADSKHTLVGLTLPASMVAGATYEYILTGVEATKGEHLNTATVSGVYNRITYSDSDKAYYTGKVPVVPEPAKPAVTVKKYVSVNEGSTWLDADTAPGPSALIDNDVWFKFIMTNSGNVTLTDLTLTDSEYNLGNVGLPAKLDPGQSFEYIFKGVKAKAGEQINIAVALAKYGNETVTDTDRAIYTGYRKGKPTPPTTGGYLPLSAILGMLLISGGIFLKKKSKALNH